MAKDSFTQLESFLKTKGFSKPELFLEKLSANHIYYVNEFLSLYVKKIDNNLSSAQTLFGIVVKYSTEIDGYKYFFDIAVLNCTRPFKTRENFNKAISNLVRDIKARLPFYRELSDRLRKSSFNPSAK